MCLSLLSNVKKGNPDGTFTFDLASKHFTQFFILSDDYKKSSTLCAMGWLPDIFFKYSLLQLYIEKVLSYHLLPVFLLIEFKEERFPNNKITLLKWELDFEESMHQALQTFHFRHTFHWKSWVRLWRRLPHEPSTLSYLRRSWRGSRDSRSIWLITYSKKFCLDGWVAGRTTCLLEFLAT